MTLFRPETIEGEWDILYRDYPEVYDAWVKIEMEPDIIALLNDQFHFVEKKIADIGSGTGASTIRLAKYADSVVGIEIEEAMNAIALSKMQAMGIRNVQCRLGDAESIPLRDCSVDVAIAVTLAGGDIRKVADEMERITKVGGVAIRIDCAPGWYGGEFNPLITNSERDESTKKGSRNEILPALGYEFMDVLLDQDYGTVDKAIETYGFIHGKAVIDYIRENGVTSIKWKMRVHYKHKTHG
jgi:ubiquinone/menaquinone biosynthesis C-methylase UbiE